MRNRSRLTSGTLQWLLAASACAGTPIEAGPSTEDTSGATEFPETTSSTISATSLETSVSASMDASWIDYECVESSWVSIMPDPTIGRLDGDTMIGVE